MLFIINYVYKLFVKQWDISIDSAYLLNQMDLDGPGWSTILKMF